MKRIYEFVCNCSKRMEALTVYETASIPCVCGGLAHRVTSAPKINLEGWSGDFPSSWLKFDQKHRDKLASERKANA